MCRLNDKLLTVILALLLGLSPLQGAVASILYSPSINVGMHQMLGQEDGSGVSSHQLCPDCQQYMAENCCPMHAGAASHCACFVVVILPETASLFIPTLTPSLRTPNHSFTSRYTASLYRPPRG
jgi:hypothetical protein